MGRKEDSIMVAMHWSEVAVILKFGKLIQDRELVFGRSSGSCMMLK